MQVVQTDDEKHVKQLSGHLVHVELSKTYESAQVEKHWVRELALQDLQPPTHCWQVMSASKAKPALHIIHPLSPHVIQFIGQAVQSLSLK